MEKKIYTTALSAAAAGVSVCILLLLFFDELTARGVLIAGGLSVAFSALFAYTFSKKLAKGISKAINSLDPEHPENADLGDDFAPFVKKLLEHNRVIEKEEGENLRREFTANVSHELKTPLTSISGTAEIIKSGFVKPEDIPHFAGNIYDEAQRLITLVGDIIKLSQLDEDSVVMAREPVDLYDLSIKVVERLRDAAAKKHISMVVVGSHAEITGVSQVLDEMAFNLCDNAIKYNHESGSVTISVTEEEGHAVLTVADTGIGIPAAHQDRVFERFYRVDKSHSKEIGGTGLGLSIVKHGAAFHNATIKLKSELGVGTMITITF